MALDRSFGLIRGENGGRDKELQHYHTGYNNIFH
jgi:hypothetical protein